MSPAQPAQNLLLRALLRPAIRFCLQHSLGLQTLFECAKVLAVELSAEEISKKGAKPNVSRLSVMTGLHRRDVVRLYREEHTAEYPAGLISRVIGQWEQDERYRTRQGKPKVLSLEGESSEFKELVRRVSTDINPAAVLFELERVGAVERTARGLSLARRTYVPEGKLEQGSEILSRDIDDLVQAVEENLTEQSGGTPNLHGRTEYDNIAVGKLDAIRKWIFKEGTEFHLRLRTFVSQYDKDINPSLSGPGGGRVVVGAFSRISGEGKK